MEFGVIADDFTVEPDNALTLAMGGMSTVQFVGVPDAPTGKVDAGELKSRTIPVAQAVAQSLAACEWLVAQEASQIIFKVCSTFGSKAHGNIGPAAATPW
ncbi:four-carbon acid sugar kinase family protein [Sulfitobacter sp.]|uniref:four-carbon acid sugar kinase family protein n=1 Tax=Sulfitobacter sp. TaxID=1903071 RepID=UPI003002874D